MERVNKELHSFTDTDLPVNHTFTNKCN